MDWLEHALGQEKFANIELVKEIESYEKALQEAQKKNDHLDNAIRGTEAKNKCHK